MITDDAGVFGDWVEPRISTSQTPVTKLVGKASKFKTLGSKYSASPIQESNRNQSSDVETKVDSLTQKVIRKYNVSKVARINSSASSPLLLQRKSKAPFRSTIDEFGALKEAVDDHHAHMPDLSERQNHGRDENSFREISIEPKTFSALQSTVKDKHVDLVRSVSTSFLHAAAQPSATRFHSNYQKSPHELGWSDTTSLTSQDTTRGGSTKNSSTSLLASAARSFEESHVRAVKGSIGLISSAKSAAHAETRDECLRDAIADIRRNRVRVELRHNDAPNMTLSVRKIYHQTPQKQDSIAQEFNSRGEPMQSIEPIGKGTGKVPRPKESEGPAKMHSVVVGRRDENTSHSSTAPTRETTTNRSRSVTSEMKSHVFLIGESATYKPVSTEKRRKKDYLNRSANQRKELIEEVVTPQKVEEVSDDTCPWEGDTRPVEFLEPLLATKAPLERKADLEHLWNVIVQERELIKQIYSHYVHEGGLAVDMIDGGLPEEVCSSANEAALAVAELSLTDRAWIVAGAASSFLRAQWWRMLKESGCCGGGLTVSDFDLIFDEVRLLPILSFENVKLSSDRLTRPNFEDQTPRANPTDIFRRGSDADLIMNDTMRRRQVYRNKNWSNELLRRDEEVNDVAKYRRKGKLLHDFQVDASSEIPMLEQVALALKRSAIRAVDIFKQWDLDHSGDLSRAELLRAFRHMGYNGTREAVDLLFDSIDADGNGFIEISEMVERLKLIGKADRNKLATKSVVAKDAPLRQANDEPHNPRSTINFEGFIVALCILAHSLFPTSTKSLGEEFRRLLHERLKPLLLARPQWPLDEIGILLRQRNMIELVQRQRIFLQATWQSWNARSKTLKLGTFEKSVVTDAQVQIEVSLLNPDSDLAHQAIAEDRFTFNELLLMFEALNMFCASFKPRHVLDLFEKSTGSRPRLVIMHALNNRHEIVFDEFVELLMRACTLLHAPRTQCATPDTFESFLKDFYARSSIVHPSISRMLSAPVSGLPPPKKK